MATYNVIADAALDPDAPLTSEIAYRWRDNPIAIAEADASVPLSLLPTVLLGAINTTSGTTATFSGLVLTPYKFLRITLNGVSFSTAATLQLAGQDIVNSALAISANLIYGTITIDLNNGVAVNSYFETTANSGTRAILSGYTNASTTILFSGGDFDAGSIRVYGVK